jgi:SAM-dependent methyltransferase
MEPRGDELIRRYRKNYDIPPEANITEQMVLAHWELERQLTLEILQSTPENRWDTFERCYSRLYAELEWLNRYVGQANPTPAPERLGKWREVIGSPPQSVYEIGSGTGTLISYLAANGFDCKGTEITCHRGQKCLADSCTSLSWGISDGVHLDRFEPPETYDAVVSDQVIEHLHPEDLEPHLKSVYNILKEGGRYVLCTPHRHTGPHDVSRVFKLDEPKGMHLREYTYRELVAAIKRAGFSRISYAFIPGRLRMLLASLGANRLAQANGLGRLYLRFLLSVEKLLSAIPALKLRRLVVKLLRKFYVFSDNICLVAEKASPANQVVKLAKH